MSQPELPVPLSATALRLADEVGQAVLDRVGAGDLASAADLDQHVAAVRAELAAAQPVQPVQSFRPAPTSQPAQPGQPGRSVMARLAGEAAGRSGPANAVRPHHARGTGGVRRSLPPQTACPDVPFADGPWHRDAVPPLRLLLHYACGLVEAAVRADWWPVEPPAVSERVDWRAMRLAAVCRLVRQAERTAALRPDLG